MNKRPTIEKLISLTNSNYYYSAAYLNEQIDSVYQGMINAAKDGKGSVIIPWPNDRLLDHFSQCGFLIKSDARGTSISWM